MLAVINKRDREEIQKYRKLGYTIIDCTSRNPDPMMSRGLSPFFIGPVNCYDGFIAKNVENAWQYSKVYREFVDGNNNPRPSYFDWRNKGWNNDFAKRYPLGRGRTPLYSYWKVGDEYQKLGYIESRKKIYMPAYASAVVKTDAYKRLEEMLDSGIDIALADFDGYDFLGMNMTYKDVVNNPDRIMGHGFVIAMCLKGIEKELEKDDIEEEVER